MDCEHRECYRRHPVDEGGLGLCPNLQTKYHIVIKTGAGWKSIDLFLKGEDELVGKLFIGAKGVRMDSGIIEHVQKMPVGDCMEFLDSLASFARP